MARWPVKASMKLQTPECVLGNLSGAHEHERLQVILQSTDEGSRVCLRQQTWGEGIGWFTQRTLDLTPDQVAQLKTVLGVSGQSARPPKAPTASHLRVYRAESA